MGPAGVGKSTLVQDVLSDPLYPFFVPYYAFLPTTDGNRDRAEALTFYQDVIGRLDRFDIERLSLGVVDIPHGRDALRRHMQRANERYVLTGRKTVLLIDGLDHVMREINLQVPVLSELPVPDEIPEGFLIILSGQPQAFLPGVIPAPVAAETADDRRKVTVHGLSRAEVHALGSKLDRSTTGEQRDALYEASRGNPLVLTYILSLLERRDGTSIAQGIALAGNYQGQIDTYYRERLSIPLQDSKIRRLLGLVSRAAPTLPVAWLAEWPEREAIEDIYERILAPFVREDGGVLSFIHDSLIAFLKSETRSRLPGTDPSADDREFHSLLADRSQGRSCLDPVGRARILYLLRAERHAEILDQLSSAWLRRAVRGFLPYAHVRPLLLAGYAAACSTDNYGQTLRLLLLGHELEQRTSRMDGGERANALLDLDDTERALAQIRFEGRLLVSEDTALKFAARLSWYARRKHRPDLKTRAAALYFEAKPVSIIHGGEVVDSVRRDDGLETLVAWSEAAALFEEQDAIVREIQGLRLRPPDTEREADPATIRGALLFRVLDGGLRVGCDPGGCRAVVDAIRAQGSDEWRFAALLRLAEATPAAVDAEALGAAHERAAGNDGTDLRYAWVLYRRGERALAQDIVRGLRHIRFEVSRRHGGGLSDVAYTVRLRWLQALLSIPEGEVPTAKDAHEEAYVRVERTARQVGEWRARMARGEVPADRRSFLRAFLLFHNQSVHFASVSPSHHFILQTSRRAIYEEVAGLAKAMGTRGLGALRDVVVELTAGAAAVQFAPHHRRYFARLFWEQGAMAQDEAVAIGVSSTVDADDDDPAGRERACLEVAAFLRAVGEEAGSDSWKARASEVSAGAGSHKDHHMAHVAEWLGRSMTEADRATLEVVEAFARAVEIAGGDGGTEAAASTLRLVLRLAPGRAWRLAVEMVDRDVLNVWHVLEGLVVGGVEAGADPELVRAVYGELLVLFAPGDTSGTAATVVNAFRREERGEAARGLMHDVRTNALPEYRAGIARAVGDTVRKAGGDAEGLTKGIGSGRDDSSRGHMLYRLGNGEVETLGQVAERLSGGRGADRWNPNPEDNAQFDWWRAIEEAEIEDEGHFEELLAAFPPSDYREVDALVQRAEVLARAGKRGAAREVIEGVIGRSTEGSWHRWLDGAPLRKAFAGLKRVEHGEGVRRARERFGRDMSAGNFMSSYGLSDVGEILELLEVDWPRAAVVGAVRDYTEQILAANTRVRRYASLESLAPSLSVDQALCRFVAELLGFPAVDVGVAARRALGRYVEAGGRGLLALLAERPRWNAVQLEHLLVALEVGASRGRWSLDAVRSVVEDLNGTESLAVRSVARRICETQGWPWRDGVAGEAYPVVVVAGASAGPRESRMLLGGDATDAWDLHQAVIAPLRRVGLDEDELRSEFEASYRSLKRRYPWCDEERLRRWMSALLVRFWLRPHLIVGREAAMRVYGRRSLTGDIERGAEIRYDNFYPVYDPALELHQAVERPGELRAMEWKLTGGEGKAWRRGTAAEEWGHYAESVGGRSLIGERTCYVRPEWEWPRERRYRGLVAGPVEGRDERTLMSAIDLTYELYVKWTRSRGRAACDHER